MGIKASVRRTRYLLITPLGLNVSFQNLLPWGSEPFAVIAKAFRACLPGPTAVLCASLRIAPGWPRAAGPARQPNRAYSVG